jgi:hypothetical protein
MGGVEPDEDHDAGTDPPLTVELLANLQAGLLNDDDAARLRQRVRANPDAQQIVNALNQVRLDVAAMGADESSAPDVAPAVLDSISAALAAVRPAGRQSRSSTRAAHAIRAGGLPRPTRTFAAGAGLAAVAVAAVLGTAALIAAPAPTPMPSGLTTARHITVSRPPMTIPLSDPQILALLDREPDYGPLADLERRASCLGGLGYPAATQVRGAQPIDIAGHPAVLLVLSDDPLGSLTALAVAPTCSSLNTGLLADRVVKHP